MLEVGHAGGSFMATAAPIPNAAYSGPAGAASAISVVLVGLGGVGQTLLHHIVSTRADLAQEGVRVVVQAVADSSHVITNWTSEGIADRDLFSITAGKSAGQSLRECLVCVSSTTLTDHGGVLAPPPAGRRVVYVDCTSSEEVGAFLVEQLAQGHELVLANKKPVTATLDAYDALVRAGRRVRYEATCGAGLPVLVTLDRMLGAGDAITSIAGALSGTLGFVMAGLQAGRPLSAVVLAAKAAGFTEPDPRDDLDGTDVARKALILGRKLGWRLELEDVRMESLFPPQLGPSHMALPAFLEHGLPSLDDSMAQRCEAARKDGKVLRYVATVESNSCRVGVEAVEPDSPLGRLQGSDNLVSIHSRCYRSSPLVIQGAGAGNDTTAAGVLADILDLRDLWH